MPSPYLDLDKEKGYSDFIEKLVEAKSLPIKTKEKELEKEKLIIDTLEDLRKGFSELKKYADVLYGRLSIFRKRLLKSDNENILSGTADNLAKIGSHEVIIKSIATRHRITSDPIKRDTRLPAADFILQVGEKKLKYSFQGGSLNELKRAFSNPEKEKFLEFSLVKQDDDYSRMVLSSQEPGSKNRIKLVEDPSGFLKKMGFFEKKRKQSKVFFTKNFKTQKSTSIFKNEKLTLYPKSSEELTGLDLVLSKSDIIEYEIKWKKTSKEEDLLLAHQMTTKEFESKDLIELDELSFIAQSIFSFDQNQEDKENIDPAEDEKGVTNNLVMILEWKQENELSQTKLTIRSNFFIEESGSEKIQFPLSMVSLPDSKLNLSRVIFINENTDFIYTFSNPQILSQDARSKMTAKNEITAPNNAFVEYKGIVVERENNNIDDLIEGATLNIKRITTTPVQFNIARDEELIYNHLINFIGQFNINMGDLNLLLSRNDPKQDAEEKEKKRHGLFRNELMIQILRDKQRGLTVKPFPTSDRTLLTLLSQIGISSLFTLGNSNDPDARKLDLDEDKYKDMFRKNAKLLGELFGYDDNGDRLIDSGFAYEVSQLSYSYIKRGATFDIKKDASKLRITGIEKYIEKKEKEVDAFKRKQEIKFAELGRSQRELEQMQKFLEGATKK